jgi:F420-dependent oxidoreductase-like protein
MKLGLQIPSFTWPGGPPEIGPTLARIARTAEEADYDSLWVMDHFFQIGSIGAKELEMLEAYTALGFMAAVTSRVGLGTLVTGVTYRHPGILAKEVTTLDVLSGGRAWLGIGAAWNEVEHRGLGVPFPRVGERFGRLEETLQICLQMWSDDEGAYDGRHYRLAETVNSPQSLSRPHPPIMIGGSGERKTLRLVARYADACNLFGDGPRCAQKLEVLRAHCQDVGRDYAQIQKTAYYAISLGRDRSRSNKVVDDLGKLSEAGIQAAIGSLRGVHDPGVIELVGEQVIPQVKDL